MILQGLLLLLPLPRRCCTSLALVAHCLPRADELRLELIPLILGETLVLLGLLNRELEFQCLALHFIQSAALFFVHIVHFVVVHVVVVGLDRPSEFFAQIFLLLLYRLVFSLQPPHLGQVRVFLDLELSQPRHLCLRPQVGHFLLDLELFGLEGLDAIFHDVHLVGRRADFREQRAALDLEELLVFKQHFAQLFLQPHRLCQHLLALICHFCQLALQARDAIHHSLFVESAHRVLRGAPLPGRCGFLTRALPRSLRLLQRAVFLLPTSC